MLKSAYALYKNRKKAAWSVLAMGILLTVALSLLTNLLGMILPEKLIDILGWAAQVVISFYVAGASLYLLNRTVLENQDIPLASMYTDGWAWFKENWKSVLKPYLIWNVLVQALIVIAGGILLVIVAGILFGSTIYSLYAYSYYYDVVDVIYMLGGRIIGFSIFAVLIVCVMTLFMGAAGYKGSFDICSDAVFHSPFKASFKDALSLAWPVLAITAVFGVGTIVIAALAFVSYWFAFLFIPLVIVYVIALMIYSLVADTAVVSIVRKGGLPNVPGM